MPPLVRKPEVEQIQKTSDNEIVFRHRERVLIADINAGFTLLPARPRNKYKLVDASQTAIGGAAGATTTVDILGTQAGAAVKLMAAAIAGLTQNTRLNAGDANGAILAAGASFADNDVNTAITVGKTGASLTTATHIEFDILYQVIRS